MLSLALPLRRIILENHPLGLHLPYVTAMHCFPQLCLVYRRCDVRILGTAASAHYRSMSSQGPRCRRSAFTLIELLTVVAVIAILAGIAFGVLRGVGQQAKVNRATAELASLTTSLEAYKKYFGDYPWVVTGNETAPHQINPNADGFTPTANDRAYHLFRALGGRLAPKRTAPAINNAGIVQRQIDRDGTMVDKYTRPFIDFSLFTLERVTEGTAPAGSLILPEPTTDPTTDDPDFVNALLDPWGNRYLYYYRNLTSPNAWKSGSYVFYSAGPDGEASPPSTNGTLPDPVGIDADNIYATP